MRTTDVIDLVTKHRNDRGGLVTILEDIQSKYGYLPENVLRIVATETGQSLVDVYGVATFYKSFSLKPRGNHLCSVCLGTACHVRNADQIAAEFIKQLGIQPKETTPDREFTLDTVNCLGACALGPIVVIDGHYFSQVKKADVKKILDQFRTGREALEVKADQRIFPVEVNCPRCNHSLMDSTSYIDGYPSIRVTVSFGNTHAWLRLSSLYGSYSVEHETEIPFETIIHIFCPHCHAELTSATVCPDCGAPMVPMIVVGGGMVQICSRRGCKGHMLDLNGVNF